MEKRIGAILIIVENKNAVENINSILTSHSDIIIGRQGLPLKDKGIHIISLVIEGNTDELGALTGKLGRLNGINVKSILMKPNLGKEN